MIWIHGLVNAFGVIIPALTGWRLESPEPDCERRQGEMMSNIYGSWRIGADFYNGTDYKAIRLTKVLPMI